MYRYALAIAAAAAFFSPVSAFSQQIEIGPGGVHIDRGGDRDRDRDRDRDVDRESYRERDGQCEQLRRACQHKEERGEQGEGNCRRYQEMCR
jgi:Ni/Co efflux regulator RcnB